MNVNILQNQTFYRSVKFLYRTCKGSLQKGAGSPKALAGFLPLSSSSYTKGQEGATAGALTAVEFLTGSKTDSAAVMPSGNSKVSPSVGLDKNSTVYVLNGKIVTPEALSAVESTKVTSVTVIKNRNHEFFKKYAEEFKKVFHADPQTVAIIKMETK